MIKDFKSYSYAFIDLNAVKEVTVGRIRTKTEKVPKYESIQEIEDDLNKNGQHGYKFCCLIDRQDGTYILQESEELEPSVPADYLISMINSMIAEKETNTGTYYSTARSTVNTQYVQALRDLAKAIGLDLGEMEHDLAR